MKLWKRDLLLLSALAACLLLNNRAHAAAPTGYDVMRVELPALGYAELLAGCTVYNEPDELTVVWCEGDGYRDTLQPHPIPTQTSAWGVMGPVFAWYPTWGVCRLLGKTEYATYTAYSITCGDDDLFAANMGD